MNNVERIYELARKREIIQDVIYHHTKYLDAARKELNDVNTELKSLVEYGQVFNLIDYKVTTHRSESIEVECEATRLPFQFQRTKTVVEPDKIALKKAIVENGELIEGVILKADYTVIIKELGEKE